MLGIIALTLDFCRPSDIPGAALAQLSLPQRLGGISVDLPSHVCPLARAAHLVERGPALRAQVAEWDVMDPMPVELSPKDYDGVDAAIADGLMRYLEERGIYGVYGTGQPAGEAVSDEPQVQLRPPAPDRHLLSAFLSSSASVRWQQLFDTASADDRIRLHSAGGPTAGASLVAPLSLHGVHMSDWQWTETVRWRLGALPDGPLGNCQNQRRNGEQCGEVLDSDHPLDCSCGPLRNARHDELSDLYADMLEEAGGIARREVYVHELSGSQEAWLDVWGYGILELPQVLLDITVRHPRASRYRPESEVQPAAAATKAENEKREKYPAASGKSVWPVVHETWGRLGTLAELFLQTCAAAARRRAHRRGRVSGGELRRWRAKLDGALQRAVALQLVAARRGLPGRRPHRRRPLDLEVLEASVPV